MGSERNTLAGGPSNAMIRRVRSVLWAYAKCKPPKDDRNWKLTWEWASACCDRDSLFLHWKTVKRRKPWPSPTEIASQYLFLVLADMRSCHALRLPFRASVAVPEGVKARLAECSVPVPGIGRDEFAGANS